MNNEEKIKELENKIAYLTNEINRQEMHLTRCKDYLHKTENDIPEIEKELEFNILHLKQIKEKIPNFNLETYELYKEYASVEGKIKEQEKLILKLRNSIENSKAFILKIKYSMETDKKGIQRLQTELIEKQMYL